jgi:thiosulfate dehydrogenase (quinone)
VLLGTDHIIAFLLHHFHLLYASLILFSAAELITGLFLMAGFLTRAAALTSIGLSVVLMLMFGWQGATCIDGMDHGGLQSGDRRHADARRQRRLLGR